MTWPVGVGLTSRGPTGALGLTMTTGSAFGGQFAGDDFGPPFGELVMVAHLRFGDGSGFVGGQ